MHDAQQLKISSIFKEQKCARKLFSYHTLQYISYLTIYRLFNVKQLKKDIKSHCNQYFLSYTMHENRCVLLKSDMLVRPMRFTVWCTPADSSDKTQLMCSTIFLCNHHRHIEPNISIFSVKHTALILVSMCLYTIENS